MTKAEIVAEIAKKCSTDKSQTLAVVEAFMDSVKESLSAGDSVYLRGFGSFTIKQRAEKVARNISKNTSIVIPAHGIPFFKPSKTFVAQVNELKK